MAKKKAKQKKPAVKKAAKKAPAAPKVDKKAPVVPPKAAAKLDTSLTDALLKVTGEPGPKKGETLPEFAYRLFVAIANPEKVSDEAFKALPQEAKDWYDKSSDLYNSSKAAEIVALPGMPGYAAPEVVADAGAGATAEQKAAPKADKAPKVAKEPKAPKVPKEKAAPKPRVDSDTYKVRLAVVKKPDATWEQVVKTAGLTGKAVKEGSHAFNTFQHARAVLALAAEQKK